MLLRWCIALSWIVCSSWVLSACSPNTSAQSAPVPSPSALSMDEVPAAASADTLTFAPGSLVAGIDVGRLTEAAAAEKLEANLLSLMLPVELQAGNTSVMLRPNDIAMQFPIAELLAEARQQQEQHLEVRVPLRVTVNESALRQYLTRFAQQTAAPPQIQVLKDTEVLSRSFAYTPGQIVDVDDAMQQLKDYLVLPASTRHISFELHTDPNAVIPRPTFEQLQQQVEAMAADWNGIVGFYLQDLRSGQTITVNADSVFSGASVMKVAIMLYAYISMPAFDKDVQAAMRAMIVDSDNLKANEVLAAAVGGTGTDAAYTGVLSMTAMLRRLGFEHSYMNMPYEGHDYLVGLRGLTIEKGPPQEGPPPFTAADPILRTTPAEMARLFLAINDCSRDTGILLATFPDQLSAARCREMLDLLEHNNDRTRIVAGIPPEVRVEHKSGWVQDMHADVAIVRSPGGEFLLSVYLWRDVEELPDAWATPIIANFARLVYTAYNPVRLEQQ